MNRYLITFQPVEPYFFGGECTFGFGKVFGQTENYYIVSGKVPSQTTLFGTLRYIILEQNNALNGQPDADKADELVGKESFSYGKTGQSFGIIKGISPLFLTLGEEWFVPTPYNHKPYSHGGGSGKTFNTHYTPFVMSELPAVSGDGSVLFPSDYNSKDGCGGGYTSLKDLRIAADDEIFFTDVRTGINSHRTEDTSDGIEDDSSFFKKECRMLKNGFRFAMIAELSGKIECKKSVVYMGQHKSPFICDIGETAEDLKSRVTAAFEGKNSLPVRYALSDTLPSGAVFPDGEALAYYMTDTKNTRNLETNRARDKYKDYGTFLGKSSKLCKMMNAGSVFFTDKEICRYPALETIGLNTIVRI